ncbi:legume-like lectin, partial [Coemansia spiralis]
LRAFNLELPYVDEGFQMRNYDFGGDAVVNTLGYIRLTPDLPSRVGWVWSTVPLPEDYWKIEFEFKIGGKGGYLYGDGMGFFVTKERASAGPVFGNRDYFNGLGVFFDTYPNGKHDFSTPFVMGMIGDGKTAYDGAHDGDANRLGMCEAYFRNLKSSTKVAVTYYKGHFINVQLKLQPKDKWINCFTITNATIPDGSYLGFTALTGEISDSHDLISVHAETL